MKTQLMIAASCAALALGAAGASAKTLVYCSEGSPENFYPAINTTGTSFDASSRPMYNRLLEFERGTTKLEPGLAESYQVSDDGKAVTIKLRKGVKFQTTKWFTPTRDFNADDVIFSFARQGDKTNPWYKVTSENHTYYGDMGFDKLLKSVDKVDDYTVRFNLAEAEAPFLADMAMDFSSILSKEYADKMMQQRGFNIGSLASNGPKSPFDAKRVRQPTNMPNNKKPTIDPFYLGAGTPAKNPIPPTLWSYNDDVKDYPFDPEGAKKLLAAAGLANGFETDLWAMPVQRPYNPNAKRIGELMQADPAKVGIKATIVSYAWGDYRKRLQQGEHQMAQIGWTADNRDPHNFLPVP